MRTILCYSIALALFSLAAVPTAAHAQSSATPAADAWQFVPEWNLRLRHEQVDDDAFLHSADAGTLRVRAGLRLRYGTRFSAFLEGEGIAAFAGDYNSGANGRTAFPMVPDARGAEINQAYLQWKNPKLQASLGRQRLLFDNQRWIGNSGWRQNEQTFDALAFVWTPRPDVTARYAWLERVHRVNGDDARDPLARERALDTHAFNLAWQRGGLQLTGYAYLHDDRDVATASTRTLGLRAAFNRKWSGGAYGATFEWAEQDDYADNPLSFRHRYWLVEPSFSWKGTTFRAGWEHLGGNGTHALQTPLATLHAFNGWADKFLSTPNRGLDDRYLAASGGFGPGPRASKFNWALAWHDYQADQGGADYGREWNASLGFPVCKRIVGLVKLADYRSDGFARDTRKLWLQLEWKNP